MDEWVEAWTDGWTNKWIDGWIKGWTNKWMDRWVGGWTSGRLQRRTARCTGGWMDGRMDRSINQLMYIRYIVLETYNLLQVQHCLKLSNYHLGCSHILEKVGDNLSQIRHIHTNHTKIFVNPFSKSTWSLVPMNESVLVFFIADDMRCDLVSSWNMMLWKTSELL